MRKNRPSVDQLPELIKRTYAGDPVARETLLVWCFDRVYLKIRTDLWRFGEDVWREVTQETLFDLLRYLRGKKLDPVSGSLPALIHGFVKNEIAGFFSKNQKQRSRVERSEIDWEQMAGEALAEKTQLDFYALNKKTNRLESFFEICLKELHAELAQVLTLRYKEDLRMENIAEQMALPHRQKAIDMHRQAIKELSRCVKQYL